MWIIGRLKDILDIATVKYIKYRVLRKRKREYSYLNPGLPGDLIEMGKYNMIFNGLEEETAAIIHKKREWRQRRKAERLEARKEKLKAEVKALQSKANRHNDALEAEVKALERKRDELKRGRS